MDKLTERQKLHLKEIVHKELLENSCGVEDAWWYGCVFYLNVLGYDIIKRSNDDKTSNTIHTRRGGSSTST